MINRDVLDPKDKMRDIMGYSFKNFLKEILPFVGLMGIVMFITYQYVA